MDPATLLGVIKVCKELWDWYNDSQNIQDSEYDLVPEIDLIEARLKLNKLQEALNKVQPELPEDSTSEQDVSIIERVDVHEDIYK